MLYAGEIIGERYKIIREIGRGGMSIVYQADDLRLGSGKLWAVKEFTYSNNKSNTAKREQERRFLREEAEIMKKLDHPTLPRIVDIIEKDETLYIVMDYIEGVSLDKVLEKRGALDQDAVIEWGKQLSSALDYLHTQNPPIIYRDMKPSNIMLKPDGSVRLIDFGIAREAKGGSLGEGSFGTRGYAAPEQEDEDGVVDARSDIYSLGITLHHLVTGKSPLDPPYEIEPIRRYISNKNELTSALEWAIQRSTQLNPNNRFQTCAELYFVLDNLQQFSWEYVRKLKRKRNSFLLTGVLSIVFAVIGLISIQMQKSSVAEQLQAFEERKQDVNQVLTLRDYEDRFETVQENDDWLDAEDISAAYTDLVQALRESVNEIYPSEKSDGYIESDAKILDSALSLGYFSNDNLKELRELDDSAYISVCYELGYLYWKCYQGSTELEAVSKAKPYFEDVIQAVGQEEASTYGLSNTQYALAKNYYLVGCLMDRDLERDGDDGRIVIPEAMKLAMGLSADAKVDVSGMYEVFWSALQGVVSSVRDTTSIGADARLKTLYRALYVFEDKCRDFQGQKDSQGREIVSAEDAEEFYRTVCTMAESLKNEAGVREETVSNMDNLLVVARSVIEGTFRIDGIRV